MIEEEAIVISNNRELAEVDIIRTKPCGLCGKTQGCGNSIWGKVFSFKKRKIQIQNNINAKVGDKVKLLIEENYLLKTSLLLYGVPLFFLFGGMIATEYLLEDTNDLVVFFGGFLGFSVGIILLKVVAAQNHTRLFSEAILAKID
jgi:sigma-E factor negative regulatory protein RseC|tara:strand:+ start:5345 stop:5779 length:435 start_codon:yes stop_codon:yes gene_type:complete